MIGSPSSNVIGTPDLAHREVNFGLGPVIAAGQLVDALSAYAQKSADLGDAGQVTDGKSHCHDATRRLITTNEVHVALGGRPPLFRTRGSARLTADRLPEPAPPRTAELTLDDYFVEPTS